MPSVVIPGHPDPAQMNPVCARLVGREYSSLTETEDALAEYFGLHGELYVGEILPARDYLYLRTDGGSPDPDSWIEIRLPPDTPLTEACWELARVADYWLNSYLPEMLSR